MKHQQSEGLKSRPESKINPRSKMKELIVSFALMSLAAGSLCAEDMAPEFTAQSEIGRAHV